MTWFTLPLEKIFTTVKLYVKHKHLALPNVMLEISVELCHPGFAKMHNPELAVREVTSVFSSLTHFKCSLCNMYNVNNINTFTTTVRHFILFYYNQQNSPFQNVNSSGNSVHS